MSQTLSSSDQTGHALIQTCQQLRGEVKAASAKARQLCEELAAMISSVQSKLPCPDTPIALQAPSPSGGTGGTSEVWAADLIDSHGRWARHVALKCAADQAREMDLQGAGFWYRVFVGISNMQKRPPAAAATANP